MGFRGFTHEEVVGVWVWSANPEEFHQVVKLTMYISTHGDGTFLRRLIKLSYTSLRLDIDGDLRQAAHSTPLVVLLGPKVCSELGQPSIFPLRPSNPLEYVRCCQALREEDRTLSVNLRTSVSDSCLQLIKLSIHPSSVGIEAGSVAGDS